MLEQIIYAITHALLTKQEVDIGALEMYLGSYELADEIVNGIKRAVDETTDPYAALREY